MPTKIIFKNLFFILLNVIVGYLVGSMVGTLLGGAFALILLLILFIPFEVFGSGFPVINCFGIVCLYGVRIGYIIGAIVGIYQFTTNNEIKERKNVQT